MLATRIRQNVSLLVGLVTLVVFAVALVSLASKLQLFGMTSTVCYSVVSYSQIYQLKHT